VIDQGLHSALHRRAFGVLVALVPALMIACVQGTLVNEATGGGGAASTTADGTTTDGAGGSVGFGGAGMTGATSSSSGATTGATTGSSTSASSSASTGSGGNGCPVLTYPSGIKIQTVKNANMTASYQGHLASGQTAPTCFLDVTDLHNPDTGETYDMSVHVAMNFQLVELVGTEVNQGWGNFVLMNPKAVQALQNFRMAIGGPVSVNSGFRGPKHQESVCNSLCGNPYGCPGTCANNSRHMWGDAFDLPTQFYNTTDTNLACAAGFKFTYLESGTHLHIDQNPAYATCVQQ
jgi:hypothetical protein